MRRVEPSIELRDVTVLVGERPILDRVNLTVDGGARVALLGPSGSGKTTLLRAIAGLVQGLAGGEVMLDGSVATAAGRRPLAPHRRGLAMVFQDLALWPHMDVRRHLAFVAPSDATADHVQATIESVGLSGRERSRPAALSGGERQRLALGRALVVRPRRLLLDEPFSSLDLSLRKEMVELILGLQQDQGFTLIHVTHDPHEAELVAERIILLDEGAVVWDGPARELALASTGPAGELAGLLRWWRGE